MDEGKILIVNVSKGKIGEDASRLLGALLITKIQLAAMSRVDIPETQRRDFCLYVDEFQNFANESFASILSEARKYNLALTVAHQYVEQMEDEVKAAVFGNVGTMIVFRVGATDAEIFEKEFAPTFIMDDIVNLSAHQIYLRLMIDGVGSQPFSARTLDPIQQPAHSVANAIIAHTRATYGRPRFDVENEIVEFYLPPGKKSGDAKVEVSTGENLQSQVPQVPPQQAPYKASDRPKPQYQAREQREQSRSYERAPTQRYEERPRYENKERDLPVRKITNDTPLPPRRVEHKREEPKKEITKDSVYLENRKLEEEFHKPPQTRTETQSHKKVFEDGRSAVHESPLKQISTPVFDDKKAVSLKDALAKAMSEHTEEQAAVILSEKEEQAKKRLQNDSVSEEQKKYKEERELKVRKEIDEDTLRKLLED